jgi:hypothetical protein
MFRNSAIIKRINKGGDMQVFVTSKDLRHSASVLDTRRLNKQVIECNQIYSALVGLKEGWKNHCVTRLWTNYTTALMCFATECHLELKRRGYNPCNPIKFILFDEIKESDIPHFLKESWFTDPMKSHLLAKDTHYNKFGWSVPIKSGYYGLNKDRKFQMYSVK